MTEIPPQFWQNHVQVRILPGIDRDPLPGSKPLPVLLKTQIEQDFKQELLQPKSPQGMMLFRLPDVPPVLIHMQRFGHTALMGTVLRPPALKPECVTLCRGRIDPAEDERAFDAGRSIVNSWSSALTGTGVLDAVWRNARNESEPLAVHIHLDEQSYDSHAVRAVTGCLAQTFFDQFGADKIDPSESDGPRGA